MGEGMRGEGVREMAISRGSEVSLNGLTAAERCSPTPESTGLASSDFVSDQLVALNAGVGRPATELSTSGHNVAILWWLQVVAG